MRLVGTRRLGSAIGGAGSNSRNLGSPLGARLETITTVISYLSCTLRVGVVSSVVKVERPTCWALARSLE